MGLQGYVGSSEDARRIRRQEKEREEQKKKFNERIKASDANVDAAGLRQFGAGVSEVLETAFKNETVGLVTRDEFVAKRQTLQERIEEENRKRKLEAEEQASKEKELQRAKKEKSKRKAVLSFAEEEEEEQAQEEEDPTQNGAAAPSPSRPVKFAKLGKNPGVHTDFLPDKDREAAEEKLREQLRKEFLLRQQAVKSEPLSITYSYWDGSGHRRKVQVRKGDTVGQFLKQVREQLAPEFRELRSTSVSNMMYVKEDLILPHSVSFYDLIVNKARGKSGPLFNFEVHEDIRLQNDASIEKEEAHAGKVVDRHWYERSKHIFPASRWEVYDPEANYDKYTVK
ncbi:hypothetical protein WJX72_012353 [[Myrmecia] bisecta]|uniref:FAM50A/XAP5 C-terminal domain-containing protein n=1 Tax=[Myrmecia] bisecta TaxID=41462 RepID=A0AAW1PE79_9CHLO